MPRFPFYKQLDAMDCGPSCLRMVAKYYGKNISLQTIRERSFLTREGVSFLGLSDAAESLGMRSVGARIGFQQLSDEIPLPAVVHWKNEHFVVVYGVKKGKVLVADPAFGLISYKKEEFLVAAFARTAVGESVSTDLPITYPIDGRCGYQQSGYWFCYPDTDRSID